MNRIPVRSSNIRSIGYDEASGTLEVEFHNGSIYQYYEVPEIVYRNLMHASSKGSYLHRHIRGRYPFQRVR